MPGEIHLADLSPDTPGVLPSQLLAEAIEAGYVDAGELRIPKESIQPASLDLRLGESAFRIRCSFLPGADTVERKVEDYVFDELDLRRDGAVLETNRPYLIPLAERLAPPAHVRGKANPKSSTGRVDVFTRVITDYGHRFDEIAPGYDGPLYLEVVPLSFPIRVQAGPVAQPAPAHGRALDARPTRSWPPVTRQDPILFRGGRAGARRGVRDRQRAVPQPRPGGRQGPAGRPPGQEQRRPARHVRRRRRTTSEDYWEPVRSEEGARLVLEPERFYLLLSDESVMVPPDLAAEMTAYDPTSGELRTHYAGFFDPGFGYDPPTAAQGVTGRARGAGPRRPVHDRAPPEGLQAHLREDDRPAGQARTAAASAPTTRARWRPSASTSAEPEVGRRPALERG